MRNPLFTNNQEVIMKGAVMKKIPQLGLLPLLALCLVAQDKVPTHKSGIAERWISGDSGISN
jgi:hypothetical protein